MAEIVRHMVSRIERSVKRWNQPELSKSSGKPKHQRARPQSQYFLRDDDAPKERCAYSSHATSLSLASNDSS